MVASVILISSDSSKESVESSTSRVILFGTILTVIPADVFTIVHAVSKVTAIVVPPVGVLDLDIHTTSETDTFEDPSFPTHALVAPITSPFLFTSSDSSKWLLKMLTARKRVHPFPARIPVNRRRFHSSSSSPPSKRRRTSPCSSSSATHSLSPMSTGPSRKRFRSFTTDSPLIRADMLPPCMVEGDIERDTKDRHEIDTESDINSDILADIEASIAAKAVATITADIATDVIASVEGVGDNEAEDAAESSARGTVKIRIDVVTELEVPDYILVPTITKITDIEVERRAEETRAVTVDIKRARLLDRIRVLERSNIGL
nr:hypothetical protein [Tanacetum cinerariifolium]